MIEVQKLSKKFGGLTAVNRVSLEITRGSITGLIGPNGAGKTTLFNVIAGNLQPSSGRIFFDGEDVTGFASHDLFHKGLLRTFQIAHEFGKLTVLENLMMVPGRQTGESLFAAWFKRRLVQKEEAIVLEKAKEVLRFLNLTELENEPAANLSGGQKKLLELGRTMMVSAKVVLLDEVGAGVNRTLLREIGDAIIRLNRERDYTFFMIEHDLEF
ncbi:MAG: ABC transporter ATP-binding protein, partial [Acidiferrobacteraceae bacterium]|nr:ABC transporter ATP-binding protein [Acidiferrobacteraceae bacterium]